MNESTLMGFEPDRSHWGWTWLERWMAAKPWENRSKDALQKEVETNSLQNYNDAIEIQRAMQRSQVKIRRNRGSVRVMPPRFTSSGPLYASSTQGILQTTPRSSVMSSDALDGSSPSSSSKGTTPTSRGVMSGLSNSYTMISNSTPTGQQMSYVGALQMPSYMASTQSAKAKIRVPLKVKPSFDDLNLKSSYNLSECGGNV